MDTSSCGLAEHGTPTLGTTGWTPPSALNARAARIAADIHRATAAWPELFRPEATWGLAAVVSTSAPDLDERDLATLGRLGAWVCAFDDLVDDTAITDDALALRIAQYEQLIHDRECPELAFDPVARVLDAVLDELSVAPLGRPLWPLLASQLVTSCRAMQWERAAAAAAARGRLAPLARYLQHGADSTCVGLAVTAAAMLIGEPAAHAHVPALLAAQRHGATAVRIANDLATWPREQAEGRVANALLFVGAGGAEALRALLAAERRALSLALAGLRRELPRTAAFIERFTDAFVALYGRGDLPDLAPTPGASAAATATRPRSAPP